MGNCLREYPSEYGATLPPLLFMEVLVCWLYCWVLKKGGEQKNKGAWDCAKCSSHRKHLSLPEICFYSNERLKYMVVQMRKYSKIVPNREKRQFFRKVDTQSCRPAG